MTETYTENEIKILKNYYSDKVINVLFDKDYGMRITEFETNKAKDGKMTLNCNGYFINNSDLFTGSIKLVAETLGLKLPNDVLYGQDL